MHAFNGNENHFSEGVGILLTIKAYNFDAI